MPPRGLPSLLLTDGLVLGVCGWAGAEEEMLCQGEKLGCCGRGALGVLGWELPALRAPVLRPWVCGPCGRSEISLSLGWVPGQRLSPGDVVPPPSTWDSGGEKAAWARGACQFVTLRRRRGEERAAWRGLWVLPSLPTRCSGGEGPTVTSSEAPCARPMRGHTQVRTEEI